MQEENDLKQRQMELPIPTTYILVNETCMHRKSASKFFRTVKIAFDRFFHL